MRVTRGQAALMLYQTAGCPAVSGEIPFTDIPEWCADAVTWAAEAGFVQGVGEERYEPNRLVSRQEFALILYRGAGSPDPYAYTLKDFADQGAVSGWARDAVRWCVGSGLLNGKDEKRLAPRDTIIVAEAALMLQRAEKSDPPEEESGVQAVSSLAEIKSCLRKAMTDAEQPPVFDIRALEGSTDPEIDVRNLYYALLSEQPELKYAYALDVEQGADARLTCTFSFMPYRTGNYPAGFAGERVSSLTELIAAARAGLDAPDSAQIRITDRSLTVDDMNKALQQVGGSYILCQLNADGTAITYTPLNALSYAEALDRLRDIDTLAGMVLASTVDGAMTARERAEALYTYVTENVRYDQRYYSDPAAMPYDSRTAYGALHDHLAICGGYAQAVQILFQKAGIPCYTVSGSLHGEYHMWDIAYLDGEWMYFDATADRGRAGYWFNYFSVDATQLAGYEWDRGWVQRLT